MNKTFEKANVGIGDRISALGIERKQYFITLVKQVYHIAQTVHY